MQGNAFKALREAAGLSQAELAETLGIALETIEQMEFGAAPIDKRTELAARYVTEQPFVIGGKSPSELLAEADRLLDRVSAFALLHNDDVARLAHLAQEMDAARGPHVASTLLRTAPAVVGMFLTTHGAASAPQAIECAARDLISLRQALRAVVL